jgi:hypothetical protein
LLRRDTLADSVFDTHAIARTLTGAGLTPAQVNAITDAVCAAATTVPTLPARTSSPSSSGSSSGSSGTGVAVAAGVIGALRLIA